MARKKEVVHTFTVRPTSKIFGGFPIDMLRYDRCRPATENDSAVITYSLVRRGRFNISESEVKLVSIEHPQWVPTEGRWKSFGWEVVMHGHQL